MKAVWMSVLTVGLTLAGVATIRAEEVAPEAVMCTKCETTWVKMPVGNKGQSYTRVGKMVCQDCRSAVENVFAGGKLEHACKSCGDLKACNAMKPKDTPEKKAAVTCAKCETTWVRTPHPLGKITVYSTSKTMACSHCDAAAKGHLADSDVKMSCQDCGDNLTACE